MSYAGPRLNDSPARDALCGHPEAGLANGEEITVDAIRPTQDARLYVNVSWLRGDQFLTGESKIFVRYETSKNTWAAYQQVSASPEHSFCVQFNSAIWRKSYGWG